jgi:hypothetical protein
MSESDVPAAEVDELRRRVAELEAERPPIQRPSRWRTASATLLFLLGTLLLPIGVVGLWAERTVNDTDRYVQTVGPLIVDKNVQNLLADRITNALLDQVDVEALVAEVLPPRAEPLSGAIENGLRSFLRSEVMDLLNSPATEQAWNRINATLQDRLVSALRGEPSGAVSVEGDTVLLDTGFLIQEVKRLLVERGFTFVEKVPIPAAADRSIVLLQSEQVTTISRVYKLADIATTWLIWVALGLLAAAILAGIDRRRWSIAVGASLAATTAIMFVALGILRQSLLRTRGVSDDSVEASVFDIVTRFFDGMLRAGFALGLVLIIVGLLAGPSGIARGIRGATTAALANLATALDRYLPQVRPFGRFVRQARSGLRVVIVAIAALSILGRADLSAGRVWWTVIVALIAWLIVDLFAAWPEPQDDEAAEATGPPGAVVAGP